MNRNRKTRQFARLFEFAATRVGNGVCRPSESIGSSCVLGDDRWAGTYGVSADYIALTHCSVEYIALEDIRVSSAELHGTTLAVRGRKLCAAVACALSFVIAGFDVHESFWRFLVALAAPTLLLKRVRTSGLRLLIFNSFHLISRISSLKPSLEYIQYIFVFAPTTLLKSSNRDYLVFSLC
jgi:hypothetical protein